MFHRIKLVCITSSPVKAPTQQKPGIYKFFTLFSVHWSPAELNIIYMTRSDLQTHFLPETIKIPLSLLHVLIYFRCLVEKMYMLPETNYECTLLSPPNMLHPDILVITDQSTPTLLIGWWSVNDESDWLSQQWNRPSHPLLVVNIKHRCSCEY